MSFASLHKLVVYLQAGLGLFAVSLGGEVDWPVRLLIAIGFFGSIFAEEPLLSRPGYSAMWNRLILLVFGLQIARGIAGAPLLLLGIEYAAFLQISRLFHRKTARDHQHIAVLALLHLVVATVLTTGLDYAALFAGFVIVTPWMLALSHLRSEIEGNYQSPEEGGRGEIDIRRVLASRRVAGPSFLVGTAALSLPLFAVTAGFFLLFPRVGMGFLSFRSGQGTQVAGFGNQVRLGGFGVIRDDPTVVLRVEPPASFGALPEMVSFRLRGTSFDHYDGVKWTRSAGRVEKVARVFEYYALSRWPRPADDLEWKFVLDPIDEPVLFLPEGTVGLKVPSHVRAGRDLGRQIVLGPGLDVRFLDGDGLSLRYSAFVTRAASDVDEPLSDEDRARYLQLPEGHRRTRALAEELTKDAKTPDEKAAKILRALRDSGRYGYTLEQPRVGNQAPLEAFLFDARAGHCEYFASAMVILLRAADVPARNVTGFVGGRFNPYGKYYAIRQGDAHSWVEAYLGNRWVTFDPTPPIRDAMGPSDGIAASVRAMIDAMKTRWEKHIVGYDLRSQVLAFQKFRAWMANFSADRAIPDGPSDAREPTKRMSIRALSPILYTLLVVFGLASIFAFVRARNRRLREARGHGEAVALYLQLEKALAKAGKSRPPSRTPREHAELLAREGFRGAEAAVEVTDVYLRARYAGARLDSADLKRLRRELRRMGT